MKYAYAIILSLGSALVAMTLATLPAQAAGLKTFVTIFGNDGNDCLTGVAACRTAQRGVDQADPGGEVVFDSAGDFFTVTITKSLTLTFIHGGQIDLPADGGPLTANILFSPPSDMDMLTVTGLNMNLFGRNSNGIQINRGGLTIRNSLIQNVGGANRSGILFQPTGDSRLYFMNNTISNAPFGLTIAPRDDANVVSVIGNSTFTWNGTGVRSIPPAGTTSDVLIQGAIFSGNGIAAQSSTGASTMRLKDSTLFANATGVAHPGGGIALSLTGNSVIANTINGTFTGTLNPQ